MEEDNLTESIPSIKNINFKKKGKDEKDVKLESIDEKREMVNEYVSVENEVDRIINEDLHKLEQKSQVQRRVPPKRKREKYSESFFVGGRYGDRATRKDKKGKDAGNLSSLNMRSFQYDKEDLEKRNYTAKLMEMREENQRLKKENQDMKKERDQKEELRSIRKHTQKTRKKALLEQMNMSLMDIKKGIDESNMEISFLENREEEPEAKMQRAKLRREKLRKEARRRKKTSKQASFIEKEGETGWNIQDFKNKFKKKVSMETVVGGERGGDMESEDVNASMMSTKSRFDELRERRRMQMEQNENQITVKQVANIAQTSAKGEDSRESPSICRETQNDSEEVGCREHDKLNELIQSKNLLEERVQRGEEREAELQKENERLKEELRRVEDERKGLLEEIQRLNEVAQQSKVEKTGEKSFNEGRVVQEMVLTERCVV
jgi:hypothetical protein